MTTNNITQLDSNRFNTIVYKYHMVSETITNGYTDYILGGIHSKKRSKQVMGRLMRRMGLAK